MSFDARVTARLIGESALAAMLLAFALGVAWSPIPTSLKVLLFIPTVGAPTFMVIAAALRHLQGGATDLEIVDDHRRFSATAIRFSDLADAIKQALTWHRRLPMVLPVGPVFGNPSDPNAVREDAAAAALPDTIETTTSSPEVPAQAATLEINVSDKLTTEDHRSIEKQS